MTKKEMIRRAIVECLVGLFGIFVLLFLFLIFTVRIPILEFPRELLFGWIGFIERVASQVEFQWLPIAFYSVGVVIVLEGAHRFFSWIYAYRHHPDNSSTVGARPRWQRRWTFGICGLALTTAVIAMAGLGIIHQTGWMVAADEPRSVVVSNTPNYVSFYVESAIEEAILEGVDIRSNPELLRHSLREQPYWESEARDYRVFLLTSATNRPGLLVFRDPQSYQTVHRGFGAVSEGGDYLQFKYDELSAMLARYSDRMYPIQ